MPFESPPPDEAANRAVEQHPRFPLAVKVTKVINAIGLGASALTVVAYSIKGMMGWSSPLLDIAPLVLIVLMPVLILVVAAFRGLIWYNMRMSVPNPSIIPAMFCSSVALLLYGSFPAHVAYLPILSAAGVIALILLVIVFLSTPEFKQLTKLDIGNLLAVFSLLFSYAYGAYTTSNCALDTAPPEKLSTTVSEKYINKNGDTDSYYLYFVPVPGIDANKMEVADVLFNSVAVGDSLYLNVKPGRWQSRLYYLSVGR